jgi:Arc/MetJ family transcription regulator
MRTTVDIDEHLLTEAKAAAARTHRSLGAVVDDALRALFSDRGDATSARQRVKLPTDGGSGLRPGVDLEDKAALSDILDEDGRSRAGR